MGSGYNDKYFVKGHAYALCGTGILYDHGEVAMRAICVFNPWRSDFTTNLLGDYAADLSIWTKDRGESGTFAEQLNHTPNMGDGIFWVEEEDIINNFASIGVSYNTAAMGMYESVFSVIDDPDDSEKFFKFTIT